MKGAVFLLVAAVMAAALAGCAGEDPGPPVPSPGLVAVAATDLEPGGFYAFAHGGGELVFSARGNGSAEVVLYGADDRRIGRIGLGDAVASGRFVLDDVPAGELVVEVRSLAGEDGLDIRSAGSRVRAFDRLPVHVERHVLFQGPTDQLGLPFVAVTPADENLDLQLLRAPSSLRLVHRGGYEDLAVVVMGESGLVLQAESPGAFASPPPIGGFGFEQVPSQAFEENVRGGRLSAQVSASDMDGVLLLEAWSYSRARPLPSDVAVASEAPRFTYGVLPDQPVSFSVRAGTERLYLLYEGTETDGICPESRPGVPDDGETPCPDAGLVALFDPDDRRVATVRVPFNQTVAVPVDREGEWVAVLLDGEATLGSDRAPADFELHPLEIRSAQLPTDSASPQRGEYGQASAAVDGQGVLFRIAGQYELPSVAQLPIATGPGCGPASLVAFRGGEAIGVWGIDVDFASGSDAVDRPLGPLDPNELLDGGPLSIVYDDFGQDCERMTLVVQGYVR